MKVSLIHPSPYEIGFTTARASWPPTGILYIASFLKKYGVKVSILDHAAVDLNLNETVSWIKKENTDILGFSVLTNSAQTAVKIAQMAKKENPNLFVVFGNMHASFNSERILGKYDCVDAIVKGEGEHTTLELVNCLEKGGKLNNVMGIVFRQNDRIVSTPEKPLLKNIDQYPFPDRNLLSCEYHSMISGIVVAPKKFTTMLSSRGCSFQCRFCGCNKFLHNIWRGRSVNSIIDEMRMVEDQGYKQVLFVDDNFTLNQKRTSELCKKIKKEKIDIEWFCDSRVDRCTYDMMREMAKSGCKLVYFGIESANQRILEYYNKRITPQQTKEAVQKTRKAGIDIIVGSFIVGAPDETIEEIRNTMNFAQQLDIDVAQFNLLDIFPGTDLWNEMDNRGLNVEKYWETGIGMSEFSSIPIEVIGSTVNKYFREFYLRKKFIVNQFVKTISSRYRFNILLSNIQRYREIIEGLNALSRSLQPK